LGVVIIVPIVKQYVYYSKIIILTKSPLQGKFNKKYCKAAKYWCTWYLISAIQGYNKKPAS